MKNEIWKGLNPERIGTGAASGLVTALVMTGVGAWMMSREILALEWMGYAAVVMLILSAFLGAAMAGDPLNGAASCACLLVVLLGINAAIFGAQVEGFGVTALALAGGCGASILLRKGSGQGHGKRRRRRKNR